MESKRGASKTISGIAHLEARKEVEVMQKSDSKIEETANIFSKIYLLVGSVVSGN